MLRLNWPPIPRAAIRWTARTAMVLTLAACGVDGPPLRPEPSTGAETAPRPGISVSGDGYIGLRNDGL